MIEDAIDLPDDADDPDDDGTVDPDVDDTTDTDAAAPLGDRTGVVDDDIVDDPEPPPDDGLLIEPA
jgi:hypothetical protein